MPAQSNCWTSVNFCHNCMNKVRDFSSPGILQMCKEKKKHSKMGTNRNSHPVANIKENKNKIERK